MEKPYVKGALKLIILELLKNPNHGYGIMAEVERLYGIKLSAGTVYPILSSLKRSGLIKVVETGDRDRKTYQITERGIEYINKNEKELNDIKRKLLAYKAFLELGGEELKEAFKQLFKSIDNLNEAQREELESTFRECARKIKLLLLGERA
ncbi:PadR family transcriptional regulator [Thermococcus sp.]|uniref:PadR family transcriptional regulator n=2 Tax=Thermococcus sp. TaxID=35749 RepID=UPI0025E24D8B|nr:PadR family transcriptional regulator [Thermococcus sp.]